MNYTLFKRNNKYYLFDENDNLVLVTTHKRVAERIIRDKEFIIAKDYE